MGPQYNFGGGAGQAFWQSFNARKQSKLAELQEARAREAQQLERDQLEQQREDFRFRVEQEQAKRQQEQAQKQAEERARLQSWGAQQLQTNPERAEFVARTLQARGAAPEWMPQKGPLTPEEVQRFAMEASGAGAQAGLEPPKQDKPVTTDLLTNLRAANIDPASPGGQRLIREFYRKGSGVNINLGEKPLPVTTVEGMADADAAVEAADALLGSFSKMVPAEGLGGQVGARVAAKVPNTDTSQYEKEAGVAAQIIGTFLEGGKLQASDYDRYRSFLPAPGDSPETAQRKVDAIKTMVERRVATRRSQLGRAGYKVPDAATQPRQGAQQPGDLFTEQDLDALGVP